MSLQSVETTSDLTDISLAEAFARLGSSSNNLAIDQNLSLSNQFWLDIALPDELTDFIVRQPNHTWNGLTIYPDEAWRYRNNDLWITWRSNPNAFILKLHKAKKIKLVDWDDE